MNLLLYLSVTFSPRRESRGVIRNALSLTASTIAASEVSPGIKRRTARRTNPKRATWSEKKSFSDPHRSSFRSIAVRRRR